MTDSSQDRDSLRARLASSVKNARTLRGETQEALASVLGVPRTAISDIESGKRDVSAVELAALARFLGESVERLLGLGRPAAGDQALMFRSADQSPSTQADLKRWLLACETYQDIENLTGEERQSDLRPVQRALSTFAQAQQLADEERIRLGLGLAPGHELMRVLEERLGVKVIFMDLDDGCSGASVLSAQFGPAILINRKHSSGRRVFTLAHEYFHLLTAGQWGGAEGGQPLHCCEVRGSSSESNSNEARSRGKQRKGGLGAGKDRVEQMADQFAGRLLLPPSHFIERLRGLQRHDGTIDQVDLIGVARYFGVSVQAVFVQLAMLKLVPWQLAMDAYAEPWFQRELSSSTSIDPGQEPRRFGRLVAQAYRAGAISRGRVSELLGVNVADVDGEVARVSGGEGSGDTIRVTLPRA